METETKAGVWELVSPTPVPANPAFEKHYTPKEIAKTWGFGVDLVRRIFESEPGVIRVGHGEQLHRRRYTSIRVPESVMRRVHRRLSEPNSKRLQ
jgi:hypothetical protein